MPTPTYDLLASSVLTSTALTVTFSSLNTIAADYRDLILTCVTRSNNTSSANTSFEFFFNGAKGAIFSSVIMEGNGSVAGSGTGSSSGLGVFPVHTSLSGNTNNNQVQFQIFDFSQTNKHKSILVRNNSASLIAQAVAARWADTSAVTAITLDMAGSDRFVAGSTFHLYGIVS